MAEQLAEASNFIGIGPENPVALDRSAAAVDPAAARPIGQFSGSRLKVTGQVGEPPFVFAEQFVVRAFSAHETTAEQQLADEGFVELAATFGGMEAVRIELLRDLAGGASQVSQLGHAAHQRFKISELSVRRDGANQFVLAGVAAGPVDRRIKMFAVGADLNDHSFDQTAHDRLAILVGRRGERPHGRDTTGGCGDLLAFSVAQLAGCRALEAIVFVLSLPFLPERRFPIGFQGGGHEPIRRVNGAVALRSEFGVVVGPLQSLIPMLVQSITFALQIGLSLQAEFQ